MEFEASIEPAGGASAPVSQSVSSEAAVSSPETVSSGNEGAVNQAPESGREAAEAERAVRRLKAQGREIELSNEEYDKYASMGYDAHSKWQEAARIREQNQLFLKSLRENPRAILTNPKLGLDIKKLAHEILYEDIEAEMMTPEQRRIKELEEKLNGYEENEQSLKARQEAARVEAETKAYQAEQDKAIRGALSASKLPVTMFTYNSLVNYMSQALKAGYDVTPEQVMPYVVRDFRASQDEFYSRPANEVLEALGDSNIKKIQQAILERARGRPLSGEKPANAASERDPIARAGEKAFSLEEWREDIRRRMSQQ